MNLKRVLISPAGFFSIYTYIYIYRSQKDTPFIYKHSNDDGHAILYTNLHICLIPVKISRYLYTYTN